MWLYIYSNKSNACVLFITLIKVYRGLHCCMNGIHRTCLYIIVWTQDLYIIVWMVYTTCVSLYQWYTQLVHYCMNMVYTACTSLYEWYTQLVHHCMNGIRSLCIIVWIWYTQLVHHFNGMSHLVVLEYLSITSVMDHFWFSN